MTLNFIKMQGAGNDFLVFDCFETEKLNLTTEMVQNLCHRQFGVGADGVMVLYPGAKTDAKWDFFNSDGSIAEMCGNGGRCAIGYLAETYFPEANQISLETLAGTLYGKVVDHNIADIVMPGLDLSQLDYVEKTIAVDGDVISVNSVNTGVPHAVIEVKAIHSYPILKIGKALVRHPIFPRGSNITFFQRLENKSEILSTTFERGVEEETLACGTGATAAGYIYSEKYLVPFPIQVKVPGGNLTLSREENSLRLKGNFETISEITIEDFKPRAEMPKKYGIR